MTTYPAGTSIRDIRFYDRGTKVHFHCVLHPQYEYMSKDPFASQMFPANEAAQRASFGLDKDECDHKLKHDVWVTSYPYTNDEDSESKWGGTSSKGGK